MLAVEPELRGDTAKSLQPSRHLDADGSVSGQNTVKRLACYAKISSRLTDRQVQARQDVIAQQRAGMFGLPGDRSTMNTSVHGSVMLDATAGSESSATFRDSGSTGVLYPWQTGRVNYSTGKAMARPSSLKTMP
jgi:hypothetical protein